MPLQPGTRLGPYEVVSALGAGGMGEVYRARDTRLGRDVAVKVLPAGLSADAERLQRFEQEARAAAALNHPNILALYDIGAHDGAPYLVTELLEGATLREQLFAGPLPVRKAVEYAGHIAHGLAAAHEKGIVHRDLKPENVFVTDDGRVKILDFGLAKLTQPEPSLAGATALPTPPPHTMAGVVLGTIGYMSPEQVRGVAAWSPDGRFIVYSVQDPKTRRDLWALPLGGDRKPFVVVQSAAEDGAGRFSPDGRWLAYNSDETGQAEVFVKAFPGLGGTTRISTSGGPRPNPTQDTLSGVHSSRVTARMKSSKSRSSVVSAR